MFLLNFVIIISAVIFILFGIDIYKHKKATIMHALVFLGGGTMIVLFALDNSLLNRFGELFGLARGADLLVYIAIILLFYFFVDLYNKSTRDAMQMSNIVSQLAIQSAQAYMQAYNRKQYPNHDILFLIRAYNESQTIGKVIDEIVQHGYSQILIVNDGSTDATAQILKDKQDQYPDKAIIVLEHTINRGGGCANKTGFAFVKKYAKILGVRRLVTYDADGQMDIDDMQQFVDAIKHNPVDLYIGSRFIAGAKTDNMPTTRKYVLWLSKRVIRLMYGTALSDPHNGFRVLSLATANKLQITADGMHYANEINEQIRIHKLQYQEVPVHIRYTSYSLAKGQKNSNSIKLAIEMIYKKLFFR